MTKEELIARLKALAEQLGRDVNLTGSKEDLAMRVAELEEEIGDGVDDDPDRGEEDQAGGEANEQAADSVSKSGDKQELVRVKTLHTLHVDAWHERHDELTSLVESGVIVRVSPADADELVGRKLATRL
ncbi:DNA-packaging protein FI [Pluralibacter gergoviae]